MNGTVEKLNAEGFAEFVEKGISLVDFWAPWCGPCQMQLPILENVARKVGEKIKVGKLNVDESPDVAAKFNIFSIPTLIIFKDGQPVKTFQGVQTEESLIKALD